MQTEAVMKPSLKNKILNYIAMGFIFSPCLLPPFLWIRLLAVDIDVKLKIMCLAFFSAVVPLMIVILGFAWVCFFAVCLFFKNVFDETFRNKHDSYRDNDKWLSETFSDVHKLFNKWDKSERWKKTNATLLCVFFLSGAGISRIDFDHRIKVKTDNLSNIVSMNIIGDIDLPVSKQGLVKQRGLPKSVDVRYRGDGKKYKFETLSYDWAAGQMEVVFVNDNYADGIVRYKPTDLSVKVLLRDVSHVKQKPLKSYTISVVNTNGKTLLIRVQKNQKISSITYFGSSAKKGAIRLLR